jgi:hypothetical protein
VVLGDDCLSDRLKDCLLGQRTGADILETFLVVLIIILSAGGILWYSGRRVKNLTQICDEQKCSDLSSHNCDMCQGDCPLKEFRKKAAQKTQDSSLATESRGEEDQGRD